VQIDQITSMIATSPEVVCRTLYQFQRDGVLQVTRASITLHDRADLERLVGAKYSLPGKFFPPFLQMSLRGRSSRSNPRLQWETASFLVATSHLDYWKKLFWTAIQGVNITIKYARAPDLPPKIPSKLISQRIRQGLD